MKVFITMVIMAIYMVCCFYLYYLLICAGEKHYVYMPVYRFIFLSMIYVAVIMYLGAELFVYIDNKI